MYISCTFRWVFFVKRKCFTDPIYPKPRKDIQNEKRKRKHKFFGTIINTQKIPVIK